MFLAGLERLLIEQIRVNPVFNLGPVHATQAEVIATVLILFGVVGIAVLSRRPKTTASDCPAVPTNYA
jgi:phosphatidylglycerol:prolipoprotein diacylglycerol transferase